MINHFVGLSMGKVFVNGVKKGEKKGEVNEIDPGDSALGWPHDVFKRQHRGGYIRNLYRRQIYVSACS